MHRIGNKIATFIKIIIIIIITIIIYLIKRPY